MRVSELPTPSAAAVCANVVSAVLNAWSRSSSNSFWVIEGPAWPEPSTVSVGSMPSTTVTITTRSVGWRSPKPADPARIARSEPSVQTMVTEVMTGVWHERLNLAHLRADLVRDPLRWAIREGVGVRTASDQRRGQRRFVVTLQGRIDTTVVYVADLSPNGLAFASPVAWPEGSTTLLLTRLPDAHGVLHDLDLPLAVRYARYLEEEGTWRIGCELVDVDIETHRVLTEYCAERQQADAASSDAPCS